MESACRFAEVGRDPGEKTHWSCGIAPCMEAQGEAGWEGAVGRVFRDLLEDPESIVFCRLSRAAGQVFLGDTGADVHGKKPKAKTWEAPKLQVKGCCFWKTDVSSHRCLMQGSADQEWGGRAATSMPLGKAQIAAPGPPGAKEGRGPLRKAPQRSLGGWGGAVRSMALLISEVALGK